MKNLFRTLIALIAILSLACTALAEYSSPFTIWIQPTRKARRSSIAKIRTAMMTRLFLLLFLYDFLPACDISSPS